jgi:DNA-binding PadR family transcriptional regulator
LIDRPLHGYDLYKRVRAQLGLVWRVEISQIYAILNAYAERGWIGTRIQSQSTRPAKKILELTPKGRHAFEEWMQQPARGMREFRVDFFLRLYFASIAGTPVVKRLVARQIGSLKHEIQSLTTRKAAVGEEDYLQLAQDFRIQQLKAIVKWLAAHRKQLVQFAKAYPRKSRISES